ncbi:hypothetical protein [Acidiphilium sp.]|uniref:hypothetical protein n=1 Tax=Acidiphilium sp. TaxID=527 RepID=UPI000BC98075|nr:hypothetical protein [Acidiphilium sp.]OZB40276.1 MAG: hypothetical protein B7X48_05605 [Acidiphilium sp. 34-60-192]
MTRNSIPNEMFDVLGQIGEVASIMQDIAAREISGNKPIAGTAIDMLARLIAGHVERGMEFTPDRAVSAPDPKPEPDPAPHEYTARADSAWPGGLDLRGLHGALSGVVTCLCGLQDMAAGVDLDGDAFEPLLATLTPWRDRVLDARDDLEAT